MFPMLTELTPDSVNAPSGRSRNTNQTNDDSFIGAYIGLWDASVTGGVADKSTLVSSARKTYASIFSSID
jgi:hypothetical protein